MLYKNVILAASLLLSMLFVTMEIEAFSVVSSGVNAKQQITSGWIKNRPAVMGSADITFIDTKDDVTDTNVVVTKKEKWILINLATRRLALYEGDKKITEYPVGVGAQNSQTPVGYFSVVEKVKNPVWVDPDDPKNIVPAGVNNPLGMRWIRIGGNYGIHGTNAPLSVGHYVSHGCVRMNESDVEDVFDQVVLGTPVEIYYDCLIINREDDHTISYLIYPDECNRQELRVDDVKKALKGYGVDTFADRETIATAIQESNATPIYVGKVYDLYLDGQKLGKRAIKKDGIAYLPVDVLSNALRMELIYDANTHQLRTPYGEGKGINKSGVIYTSDIDASQLFHVSGVLTSDYIYELITIKETSII